MKILILTGFGRSGIDLLQSLFDKHPEVSQFPGIFVWPEFYNLIKNEKKLETIAKTFINQYQIFFDSRLNLRERHHQLGEEKNLFYEVDKQQFVENFIKLFNNKEINKKNIFLFIHLAYSLASGENIERKKFIVVNLHRVESIKSMDGFDCEVLFTIRNPIACISSSIKHWLLYESGKHTSPWQTHYHIERYFSSLKKAINKKLKVHIIKLESVHRESEKTFKNLSKKINMKYDECLLHSTYHGKKWWGDALSIKYLNGLNPEFKNNIDYDFFFQKDIRLFQYYLKDFFIKYKYDLSYNYLNNKFLKYLPLKVELIIFKKEILHLNFKNIILAFYYWLKRVSLMKKDHFKDIDLPSDVSE